MELNHWKTKKNLKWSTFLLPWHQWRRYSVSLSVPKLIHCLFINIDLGEGAWWRRIWVLLYFSRICPSCWDCCYEGCRHDPEHPDEGIQFLFYWIQMISLILQPHWIWRTTTISLKTTSLDPLRPFWITSSKRPTSIWIFQRVFVQTTKTRYFCF